MRSPVVRSDVGRAGRESGNPFGTRSLSRCRPGCDQADGRLDVTCGDAPRQHQADGASVTSNPQGAGSSPARGANVQVSALSTCLCLLCGNPAAPMVPSGPRLDAGLYACACMALGEWSGCAVWCFARFHHAAAFLADLRSAPPAAASSAGLVARHGGAARALGPWVVGDDQLSSRHGRLET
jgi:hypothetical protein